MSSTQFSHKVCLEFKLFPIPVHGQTTNTIGYREEGS